MKISAIYMIQNLHNHKKYVGSSRSAYSRRNGHFSALRIGNHGNHKLQKEFNQYGEEFFEWKILESVPEISKLQEREQYWIDTLHPEYNIRPSAENVSWEYQSERTRREASERRRKQNLGRKQSQEEKDRRAKSIKEYWATHPAKTIPQKMREHLSKINTGKKNPNWGKKRTPEQLKRQSDGRANIEYTFQSPDGEFFTFSNLSKAPIPVPYGALRNLYRGLTTNHKGWTFVCTKRIVR